MKGVFNDQSLQLSHQRSRSCGTFLPASQSGKRSSLFFIAAQMVFTSVMRTACLASTKAILHEVDSSEVDLAQRTG
jgi:hypothetical protein